jgi:hypothetical protein
MRSRWFALVAVIAVATTVLVISLVSSSSAEPYLRIHVIEHATTDTVTDLGAAGDSPGDLLTFHNDVYDASDTQVVAMSHGDCIRIEVGVSWECRWVTIFEPVGGGKGGSIAVEGPFFDAEDSALAVTGGTGVFGGIEGTMSLHARSASEFDFIFRLTRG